MWLTGLVAPWHVGSSQTRARTRVPCIGRQILNHCATREAPRPLLRAGASHPGAHRAPHPGAGRAAGATENSACRAFLAAAKCSARLALFSSPTASALSCSPKAWPPAAALPSASPFFRESWGWSQVAAHRLLESASHPRRKLRSWCYITAPLSPRGEGLAVGLAKLQERSSRGLVGTASPSPQPSAAAPALQAPAWAPGLEAGWCLVEGAPHWLAWAWELPRCWILRVLTLGRPQPP